MIITMSRVIYTDTFIIENTMEVYKKKATELSKEEEQFLKDNPIYYMYMDYMIWDRKRNL